MKTILYSLRRWGFVFVTLFLALAAPIGAQNVTQNFTLRPGWNSIYLETQPTDPDLSSAFNGKPVESVWAFENKGNAPDFVQEISEEALAKMGWISWVQTNRVDAFQSDLFKFQVNRAYLVKNSAATNVAFSLTGRPSLRKPLWQPNAWNFLGFPVDPGFAPTFLNFFTPSPAHYSTASGLQAIYRLNASGGWQLVAPSDLMAAGEGYWVFCKGASDYLAPLSFTIDSQDGLNFESVIDEVEFSLANLREGAINATVTDLQAPTPNPFSYADRSAVGDLLWIDFAPPLVRTISGKGKRVERFGVRRAKLATGQFETTLQIIDGAGTRLLAPVSVIPQTVVGRTAIESEIAVLHTGLWIGAVRVNAVSEAHSGTLVTNVEASFTVVLETNAVTRLVTSNNIPNSVSRVDVSMATTATGGDFNLRVLVHVDATGQARLLKEVIQMWKDGSTTNDVNGAPVVDVPGRLVLVTDDTLLNQFSGLNGRDGTKTGRRVSAAGFDFAGTELAMSGSFEEGASVRTTNSMSATFARNPFRHKYHPDHKEGLDIKRVIELEVGAPPTNAPPGYGDRILDGTFRETISGLHRTNIVVTGPVRFTRISTVANLNQ